MFVQLTTRGKELLQEKINLGWNIGKFPGSVTRPPEEVVDVDSSPQVDLSRNPCAVFNPLPPICMPSLFDRSRSHPSMLPRGPFRLLR